jgi:ATP-dependent helicase/nuclease subunit A
LKEFLSQQIESLGLCVAATNQVPEFSKVSALLSDTIWQLERLRGYNTWDEIVSGKNIDFGRLTFPRKHDEPELAEQVKALRKSCKEGLEKFLRAFADPTEQIGDDMNQVSQATRGIVSLVRQFAETFEQIKRRRRLLDFGDLEHRTLDLLLGKSRSGQTRIAKEIGQRFREVLVDEYQDSNAVQDAIFAALTDDRQNCFMVGDVKQSIYQFRLADPGIFLDKYKQYVNAEEATAGQGRKVLLSSNFRSGGAVLDAVNDVFRQCMSPSVGGLRYTDEEALNEGVPHVALGEPEVELHAIDVQDDTYDEEAAYVAQRIKELLNGHHMVRQGDELRPIVADDIVILLRSPGSVGHHFVKALERQGIRCTSGGGQDLLQTAEIMTLRSLLQTISNPRQDIPLLSALASPIFGFTADDLASIRSANRRCSMYDVLSASEHPKAAGFMNVLSSLRDDAAMNTLAQLLEDIFSLTHLDSIYAAMPDGHRRVENLRSFFQLAVDFEASGRRDLNQFLEHLELMEDKGLIAAGEQSNAGCVTIMSIHRSKGLEFPVVFLCGLARKFNREDLKAQVLCDRELGLGLSVFDSNNRIRYPTIARRAIAAKLGSESLSEEMRVLYVAMTRARDRLIMTFADQRLDATLADIAMRLDLCPGELMTRDVNCPGEWILQSALRRAEAGELFSRGCRPRETEVSDRPWLIKAGRTLVPSGDQSTVEPATDHHCVPADQLERIGAFLGFHYPFEAATTMPSKQTATQLKGREKDDEAAQNTIKGKPLQRNWRRPSFRDMAIHGKDYGNAIHRVLQYIRYDACSDRASLERELQRLVAQRFITKEQAEIIDREKILRFFASDLGTKLRKHDNVLREFKFSILNDAGQYADGLDGEKVLLQGVVDCALLEDDGIIVIDFKTDYVTDDSIEIVVDRYRSQIGAYAEALSRIYQMPVKDKYLYLFHLDRFVQV